MNLFLKEILLEKIANDKIKYRKERKRKLRPNRNSIGPESKDRKKFIANSRQLKNIMND